MSFLVLLALLSPLNAGPLRGDESATPPQIRSKTIDFVKERNWWSYKPISDAPPPQVDGAAWCQNDIDKFILAKLHEHDLEPAPIADRIALIRRAYYDLTGLPPTPEDVDAFVHDTAPDAWPRLIEKLLASPQYGERWGRHWLDLVRYADTNGFERDSDKLVAWRYRDWVIGAFNSDKPYDRFLIEQLAGDELPDRSFDTMIATGYFRLGMWDDEVPDLEQALADDLDGIVDTTARTMLGMGLGCARCHDHKGDPIRQSDYYAFAAFFAGLKPYKNSAGNGIEAGNVMRVLSADFGKVDEAVARIQWRKQRNAIIGELLALEASAGALPATNGSTATAPDRSPSAGLQAQYKFETKSDAPENERAELRITVDETNSKSQTVTTTTQGTTGQVTDLTWGQPGRFGLCGTFDGGDDRITIPRSIADDFTISFWFKTDRLAQGTESDPRWFTGNGLVDGEIPGIVDDFGISIIGNGIVAAGVGNPETFVNTRPGLNDGQWHHVAFTRAKNTGEIALFIDGMLSMHAQGGKQSLQSSKTLVIGGMHPGGGAFTGAIDEVRLYDRALEPTEILSAATGVGPPAATVVAIEKARDDQSAKKWESSYRALNALQPPAWHGADVLCAAERDTPITTYLLMRGSPHAPAEEVKPAVPQVAQTLPIGNFTEVYESESSGRRLALAKWITDPRNQFTARTMVNRIWQHHFNRAICPTPNDLGHFGEMPTHPELLDWLASEFVASGWSMKHMHRVMMNSAAYQMNSTASEGALKKDAPNDLLSRFRMRRLESEEIRDSLLAVNGTINLQMGGPGFRPPMPAEVLATSSRPDEVWPLSDPASWSRRSVYIHAKRSLQHPLLAVFDQADIDNVCPVRFSTVQPTQALTMLNSKLTNAEARVFAERVRREFPQQPRAQVIRAMRLAYGRPAQDQEVDEAIAFVNELQDTDRMTEIDALSTLTLALINTNEFTHVE